MPAGTGKPRKDGVPVNARIGPVLVRMLDAACAVTGQSKTVAVERAIAAYCRDDRHKTVRKDGRESGDWP